MPNVGPTCLGGAGLCSTGLGGGGLGGPLIKPAVERGGHIRVGLEDRPWGVRETNRALVEEAVNLVRAASGDPATAADVRATCAAADVALRRGSAYLAS